MSTFNISELNFIQIGMVSGGQLTQEEMRRRLGACITSVFMNGKDLNDCLTVTSCGERCVTRCMPNKKPRECSYEAWGILHDLEAGTIQKCIETSQDKLKV